MTYAITQGTINATSPNARSAWEARRRSRLRRRGLDEGQTPRQFAAGLAQLQAFFPGNVKVH